MPHSFALAIVVISNIVIYAINFGLGPLAYTVASEAASGRNRSKISSSTIVTFFFTGWVISFFTSPYIYYSANLGPMLGLIYARTICNTLAYIWFCVGETTGRSMQQVEMLFQRRVPVRQWASYAFAEDRSMANAGGELRGIDEKQQEAERVESSGPPEKV
jgi:hypothetical protein